MNQVRRALLFIREYVRARYVRVRSRSKLERTQQRRLRSFVRKIRAKSPYYRRVWQSYSDEQWAMFPLLDKATMMEHFTELNTVGINREEAFEIALAAEANRDFTPTLHGVTIGLSSGTSGHRGLFLVAPEEQVRWAGMVLGKLLPTSLLWGRKERIAFFLRANSNLYESVNRRRIQFSFYDLLLGVEAHWQKLEQQQPTLLIAPASVLRMIASAVQGGILTRIAPRKIIAVAEVVEPHDRHYIEGVFGLTLHQVYQCTEGFLGATCEYGTLHLNETQVMIEREYVDEEQTRFVPIITDFRRMTQPIVRYRLNDVLRLRTTPCPCGSALTAIDAIEGRCDDVTYFRHSITGRPTPIFADFIRRVILRVNQPIDQYIAEQESMNAMTIYIKLKPEVALNEQTKFEVKSELVEQFKELCAQFHVVLPRVNVSFDYPEHPADRKLRRIRRLFSTEDML